MGARRAGNCEHVIAAARQHGVTKAIKSKSMLSEEAQLNAALTAAGIQPVETDLGEYILQIADNEVPAHHRTGGAQESGRGGRPSPPPQEAAQDRKWR